MELSGEHLQRAFFVSVKWWQIRLEMVILERVRIFLCGSFWAGRGPGRPISEGENCASTRLPHSCPSAKTLWGIVRKGSQVVPVNPDADVRAHCLSSFWVSVFCLIYLQNMKLFPAGCQSSVERVDRQHVVLWGGGGGLDFRGVTAIGKGSTTSIQLTVNILTPKEIRERKKLSKRNLKVRT